MFQLIKYFKDHIKKSEVLAIVENPPLIPLRVFWDMPASKVAEWVSMAWNKVPETTMEHSFNEYSITTSLNVTESQFDESSSECKMF